MDTDLLGPHAGSPFNAWCGNRYPSSHHGNYICINLLESAMRSDSASLPRTSSVQFWIGTIILSSLRIPHLHSIHVNEHEPYIQRLLAIAANNARRVNTYSYQNNLPSSLLICLLSLFQASQPPAFLASFNRFAAAKRPTNAMPDRVCHVPVTDECRSARPGDNGPTIRHRPSNCRRRRQSGVRICERPSSWD